MIIIITEKLQHISQLFYTYFNGLFVFLTIWKRHNQRSSKNNFSTRNDHKRTLRWIKVSRKICFGRFVGFLKFRNGIVLKITSLIHMKLLLVYKYIIRQDFLYFIAIFPKYYTNTELRRFI